MVSLLSLDTLTNAAFFFAGKWTPDLKRNQSRDLLRLLLNKLHGAGQGNLFHARIRASHASLAADLALSREWTCKLIGRLRTAGWVQTEARRLPDGTQEIALFRPGRMMKRLLLMLLRSKQRGAKAHGSSRVNTSSQQIPLFQKEREKNPFLSAQTLEKIQKTPLLKAWLERGEHI